MIVAIGTLHLEFRRRLHIGFGERAFVDDVERRIEKEQETRTAGVDHTGIGEHLEQGRRALQRLAPFGAGGIEDAEQIGADSAAATAASLDSRTTVRIVPSTGLPTAPYAPSAAAASAEAKAAPSTDVESATVVEKPRRICDMITPLLPRAPMSEPWAMALHTDAMSGRVGVDPVEFFDDRTQRERHVGTGVAIGHRVHVEVVHRLTMIDQRVTKNSDDLAKGSGIERGQ